MKRVFISSIAIALSTVLYAQPKLDVKFMVRGYFYGGTSIVDSAAPGGFASSQNVPKQLDASRKPDSRSLELRIDTTQKALFAEKFAGYTVYLINNTDTITSIQASDGRLPIIAEAWVKNKWQPIEYLPQSWCGNSYHQVFARAGEYWQFEAPVYKGSIRTKIRYKLMRHNSTTIYSNEIVASINPKQLTDKEGHTPGGIMDPYSD